MTRRAIPTFKAFKPISARSLNGIGDEIGRIVGLMTGGDDLFYDNACGRFMLPPRNIGTGVVPMIVTEMDSSLPAVVYRTSHGDYGFAAKRIGSNLLETGAELLVHADMMSGVIYTDTIFWASRQFGKWYVVSQGADFWSTGVSNDAIDADGTGTVELYAAGPLIEATSRTAVPISTSVDVEFDDKDQTFAVTAQSCPAAP